MIRENPRRTNILPLPIVITALRCVVPACLLAFAASSLAAQAPAAATAVDTAHHDQTLFTAEDAVLAAGFGGLTAAMYPADKYLAHHLRDQARPANAVVDKTARVFETISVPGSFIIGPAVYLYGRHFRHPGIEDLGWHGTEAVILATGITGILKGTLGRSRPYVTSDSNPHDFRFLKGFSGEARSSFPSEHATAAFAAAAAVTSEVQRMWPGDIWYVAPVLYGGATANAIARMYHDKHWASDVAIGAGIGTVAGLKVVRYSHQHPDNRIDRILLGMSIVPDGHGGGVIALSFDGP